MPKILQSIAGFLILLKNAFDFRDLFFFGGLAMMGYGLYLISPSISFTVVGFILMLTGYLIRKT